MEDKEFNRLLRILNKDYYELFGEIPCITDFSCGREKYLHALSRSIGSKEKIEKYLNTYEDLGRELEI